MASGRANMHKLMPSANPRISRITCSADGCDMKSGTNTFSEIKMFFFPSNPIRRRTWELAARAANWKSHKNSRICSKHFITGRPSKDPDHPDYVPSIFNFNKNSRNSKNFSQKARKKLAAGESCRNPARSSHEGTNIITSCGIKGFRNKGFSSKSVSSAFNQSLKPINSALTQMMHKLTDMEEEREQLRHELALCRGDIHQLREAHQDCVTNAPSISAHSMPNSSSSLRSTTSKDTTEMIQSLYSDEQAEVYDSDVLPSQYLEQIYHQPDEASENKKQTKKKKSKETISNEMMSILEQCQSQKQTEKKRLKETISDEMMSILEECQSPEKKREKISSLLSKSISESPEDGKSSDTSSPITIIYLKP